MEKFNKQEIMLFCDKINMPNEMKNKILNSFDIINISFIETFYKDFYNYSTAKGAYNKLKEYTKTLDNNGICELTILLGIAIGSYKYYLEMGISEEIYIDTMKSFSRFVLECYKWNGFWCFDRGFWIWRHISLVLFRIEELEFEICICDESLSKILNISVNEEIVFVHIPNDAICTVDNLHLSYDKAKIFFKKYFKKDFKIFCSSWLLGKELDILLSKNSRILNFRKDYDIIDNYVESEDYLQWVFDRFDGNIKDFVPKTYLQEKIKSYVLEGGKMTVGFGILNY